MLKDTTDSAMWSPTNRNLPSVAKPIGAVIPLGLEVADAEPTALRAPVELLIINVETVLPVPEFPLKLLANRSVPVGLTARPNGLLIPANGDPGTGVNAPLPLLILNTERLLSFWLATKTKRPIGSTAIPRGVVPVGKGEPETGVSIPVPVFTENADTLLAPWLVTKSTLWTLSMAMNSAPAPDATGEETGERLPVELMANVETVPDPELLTNAKPAAIAGMMDIGELLFVLPQPFTKGRVTKSAKMRMNNRIGT